MFTPLDARWLSETAGALYAAKTVAEMSHVALGAFHDRFRLHSFAFEEIGQNLSSYALHQARCAVPPPSDHQAYFHDHPFTWVVGDKRPPPVLHLQGEVGAAWERTDHFNGIARPMGWNDQMMIVARAHPTFVSVGLHRDGFFSAKEKHLAAFLQPHVARSWNRVQPASSVGGQPETLDLALSSELRPSVLNNAQVNLLQGYFPTWRGQSALPRELMGWLRQSLTTLCPRIPTEVPTPAFCVDAARGRLLVRCFPSQTGIVTLRMIETPPQPNFFQLRSRGLTARECEVLHWISHGKRDAEIAIIIGAATRTVKKHVEHVLRKLSAESRGDAVQQARAWLNA